MYSTDLKVLLENIIRHMKFSLIHISPTHISWGLFLNVIVIVMVTSHIQS